MNLFVHVVRHSGLVAAGREKGTGIALKSYLEVRDDLKENRLATVLDDYLVDFKKEKLAKNESVADLYIVYPSRQYLPKRVKVFMKSLQAYLGSG